MRAAWLVVSCAVLTACSGTVDYVGEEPGSDETSPWDSPPSDPGEGSGAGAGTGMACRYLHGVAGLTEYDGDNYASSAFSFEYASQDPEVTYNEFDLLYEGNYFRVNLVVDDESFIVDLGNLPLTDVPPTVDPDDYPVGQWGEHDAIQAHIDHTYFVRSVDGAGRLVAAFRVVGLEPGIFVTIEWVRSTDPDQMVIPLQCL